MKISNIFAGLRDAVIIEETTASDGSQALPSEMYQFIQATEPSRKAGMVRCQCKQADNFIEKEISALAMLELIKEGTSVYKYTDMMLGMCRVLGGVAKYGENDTFTKKLTII